VNEIYLRSASEADARFLFDWANDATTREVSFSSAPIAWETHQAWLKTKLADRDVRYYIAVGEQGDPVAQIRFELKHGRAVVSVSVAPQERRKGYGERVLLVGAEELWASSNASSIDAYIKPDNAVSVRTFAAVGYRRAPDCIINGAPALHMVLERPAPRTPK